jgi:hypothetical protein
MTVKLDDSVYFHFGTTRADTGAATDADSTPTITIEEDGAALVYAPTVTNVATGLYRVTVAATAANGFEAGKRYSGYAVATVNAVTGRDGIFEFECVARSQDDLAYPATSGRSLAVSAAGSVDADLTSAAVDAVLDDVIEGTLTFRQALRLFLSALAGKSDGGGTATITFRDLADSKDRITATVDTDGNRTAITLDGA